MIHYLLKLKLNILFSLIIILFLSFQIFRFRYGYFGILVNNEAVSLPYTNRNNKGLVRVHIRQAGSYTVGSLVLLFSKNTVTLYHYSWNDDNGRMGLLLLSMWKLLVYVWQKSYLYQDPAESIAFTDTWSCQSVCPVTSILRCRSDFRW